MLKGKVKWFDDGKGYGFIEQGDGKEDAFFHFSAIESESRGRKTILDGTEVEYDVQKTPRGYSAIRVRKVEANGNSY